MQLHEAQQVMEVQGQASANALLGEGWVLLAVVASTQAAPWYILGKRQVGDPGEAPGVRS